MDAVSWTVVTESTWTTATELDMNASFKTAIMETEKKCAWNAMNSCLACLLFVTFVLNVMSSVVLFRVPLVTVRGRSNPVYLCIRFLNVCDILQAFFLILMPAFATPDCGWLGGRLSCDILGFIVLFFLLVSPLITILMAFDRVIALYQPFKYRSHLGLKMLKMLLPAACTFVFIATILPIFGVGEYHVVKGRRLCLLDTITEDPVHHAYVIGVHIVFLISLLFMVSCSIAFQAKLFRMSVIKKESRKKASSRRTRNATITTMAVCCIFIFCYLPYVVRVLVEASTKSKSPAWITWITFGLAFMQPLLNPIVYVGTNVRYRQELQMMLKQISATETETSSESGVTHVGSRKSFTGFRRKLSSGGSRNSRRGSNKKRAFGSHNSVHTPGRISAGASDDNVFVQSDKLQRNRNDQGCKTVNGRLSEDAKILGSKKGSTHRVTADISSSADSASYFGMKTRIPSPLASNDTGIAQQYYPGTETNRYGRGADTGPLARDRSNTASEDKSPFLDSGVDVTTNLIHYTSVPTLLEARVLARSKLNERKNANV